MTKKIFTLASIYNNLTGYSRIAELFDQVRDEEFSNIAIDFSSCHWLDANMSASIGVMMQHIDGLNEIELINFPSGVEATLRRNKFLTKYGYPPQADSYRTSIPFSSFEVSEPVAFANYLRDHLATQQIPKMTEGLSRRFQDSILEIFANSAAHSETKMGVIACGQSYPAKQCLDFSIADGGVGIRRKIAKELNIRMNSDRAIEWALEEGNTVRKGPVPGGLGLKLLREFITLNKGRLQIVSDRGYWELSDGKVTLERMDHPFPGTVVNIEINTADTSSYMLSSEKRKAP